MKRLTLSLFLILLLLVLSIASCGRDDEDTDGATPVPPTATMASVPVEPAAASTPTVTPMPPTATPEPTAEEEALLTAEQLASLDELDSYRAYTLIASQGTAIDGSEEDITIEVATAYTSDPVARYVQMKIADEDSDTVDDTGSGTLEFYQLGDNFYASFEETWVQMSGQETPFEDPDSEFLMNSGALLSDLDNLERQRPDEQINGVDSRHYTFEEDALAAWLSPEAGAVTAKGEVWIAKDGDYVTRYVLDVEIEESAGGLLAPTLSQGTLHMEFELSDVNSDIVIEIPKDAATQAALAGFDDGPFPVPTDATTTMSSAEFTILLTELTSEETQAFYEEALSAQGWTLNEDATGGFGDFMSMEFSKGPLTLSLLISPDEASGKTQVMAGVE